MISKISFFSLCVENMKRRLWLLVLSSLTFFISMPLAMMILLQNEASYEWLTEERLRNDFSAFFGVGMNTVFAAGFAIICAVAGFAWLYSKKKVDLYHSIPVKRETMFAACYVNGIVLYVLPYLVSCLICLVIISQYMTVTKSMLSMAAATFGIHVLFFLLFYNVMLVAVMLTGNMINCLITGGVLFIYALAVRTLLEAYLSYFIVTHYENWSFVDKFRFTSPVLAMIYFLVEFVGEKEGLMVFLTGASFALYLVQCIVITVLAGALALVLYKKRPSEAAGKSIAFSQILHLYRILLVIPLSLGSGIFFSAMVRNGSGAIGTAWLRFGLIFGLVLSHGFIEVLFQMDIRGMFSYKRQLLATGVVVFLIAFSIRGDWYGFNRSMPKQKDIQSIALYLPGLDEGSVRVRGQNGLSIIGREDYNFHYMQLTPNTAFDMAKRGMEYTASAPWGQGDNQSFYVKYNLKNGKAVYKRYWLGTDEMYSYMEEIYNSAEYKEAVLKVFQEYTISGIGISDIKYQSIDLDKSRIPEFLEIYCREYKAMTMRQAKESGIELFIDFNCQNEDGDVMCWGRNIPVYGACKETISFVMENGGEELLLLGGLDAEKVASVRMTLYDEDIQITITDKAELEQLLPYIKSYRDTFIFSDRILAENIDIFVQIRRREDTAYGFNAMLLENDIWREIVENHKDDRNSIE